MNLDFVQLIAVVQPDAVLELGGGPHSPWIAPDKRDVLAEILAQALRLKVRRRKACRPSTSPATDIDSSKTNHTKPFSCRSAMTVLLL